MSKVLKNMLMNEIKDQLGDVTDVLVIDSSRLDAITDNRMRIAFHENNIHAMTVRNKLALRVFHDAGIESLDEILAGPSTLVWGGEDIVQLSKEISKWAKDIGPLEIKGYARREFSFCSRCGCPEQVSFPGRTDLPDCGIGFEPWFEFVRCSARNGWKTGQPGQKYCRRR